MSDGCCFAKLKSRLTGGVPALLLAVLFGLTSVQAQVGGNGPDPIPAFTQDLGGGTAPTVNFDPSPSYLPAPAAGQTFQYTLIWDFGDGSGLVTVGPDTAANVLVVQPHPYPNDFNQFYTVTLRIDVSVIANNTTSPGPSAVTNGQVHVAQVNFPPAPSITALSSPATGQLPYQYIVDTALSNDSDGYITWAAIDWGDGSTELLSVLPPSKVALPYFHSYTAQGNYTVTLSVIDNGRMDAGTPLNPTPPANDPIAALKSIQGLQTSLIDAGFVDPAFDDPMFLPILRQEFIQVQVPGNLLVLKGQFSLRFDTPNSDSFDTTFVLNTPVTTISNAKVQVFLGNSLVLKEFVTDLKGNFFDQAQGFSFQINPRKRSLRVRIKKTVLTQAFAVSDSTVVNGFVDVPVRITIQGNNNATMLGTKLRFTYNATQGKSGVGKKPRSQLVGN